MKLLFKVKVAHVCGDGSKLEYETILEARDHEDAYRIASDRFAQAVKSLAGEGRLVVTKTKIEGGYEKS